jgi:uncharacterized protein (TIGR02594 family)
MAAEPKYLTLARAELGVKEAPGAADNPRVMAFYRDAGHPEIEHDDVPWCAAFVGAMLERSGVPSSKSLMARSYLTWGKRCEEPEVGAIGVKSRGNVRSIYGHVGIVTKWDDTHVWMISGNESDRVSEIAFLRSTFLGFRVPVTASNSRTLKAATTAVVAQATGAAAKVAENSQDIIDLATQTQSNPLMTYLPMIGTVCGLITLACLAVVVWARLTDQKDKGR